MARSTRDPVIIALRDTFDVTIAEASGLALLARGGVVTFSEIRDVYCNRPNTDPIEARSFVKRVRAKLIGLQIITYYAMGYELAPDSLEAIRQVIKSARKTRSFLPSFSDTIVSTRTGASA